MELNDDAQDLIDTLKDIILEDCPDWENDVEGFIKFIGMKNKDYNQLSYPIKCIYLKNAFIELADGMSNAVNKYYEMADCINDYDEECYEETEDEEDIEEIDSRKVETDVDIFKEPE